jgi:hypothetical protein
VLAFLARRQNTPTPETTEQPQQDASSVVMRFLTQGGAQVHVTHVGTFTRNLFSGAVWGEKDHRWTCLGCGNGSGQHDYYPPNEIRDAANEHATNCRSMPKPATA